MMLQALCELTQREHRADDLAMESRPIDYILWIDLQGHLLSLIETKDEKGHAKEFIAPRTPKKSSNVEATPLAATAMYVLGVQSRKDGKAVNHERLAKCTRAFAGLLGEIQKGASDPGLKALEAFLSDMENARAQVFLRRPKLNWTGSERLAFKIADDADLLHQRPIVLERLRAMAQLSREEGAHAQCLVTGRFGSVERLHPGVKRIPGGQTSGASLVSFNSEAFCSYGLTKGNNAPVGVQAAQEYVTALNWLLEPASGRRHRYGVEIGDAVLVFWCRKSSKTADLIVSLFDPTEQQLAQNVSSPFTGLEPLSMEAEPFYAVSLSAGSRVVVRDWLETTTAQVQNNLRQYWEDMRLAGGDERPRPLWRFLESIKSPDGGGVSPSLAGTLVLCALRGNLFPAELLSAALRRVRIPIKDTDKDGRWRLYDRCSLIKAVLNRQFRATQRKELAMSLDESRKDTPYLLGRLFAVMERLQGAALGKVNATIRDKFFSSASSRPALVFPQLLRLSAHHAAKAVNSGWLEKIKSEVMDGIARFPATLPLEDQGLFAIGYYHQRQRFFEKRET